MSMLGTFRVVLMFIFGSIIILAVLVPLLNITLTIHPLVNTLLKDWFGLAILVGCLGLVGSIFLPDETDTEAYLSVRQGGF